MATELFTTSNCNVLSLIGQFSPTDSNINPQDVIAYSDVNEKLESIDLNLPLIIILDSIGGSVLEATSIVNLLNQLRYENVSFDVTVLITNRAYSAATILTSCVPKVVAVSEAQLMIHGVSVKFSGNEDTCLDASSTKELYELLDLYNDRLAYFYSFKSGLAVDTFKTIIDKQYYRSPGELYMDVHGAKNLRLVDLVVEDVQTYFSNNNLTCPTEIVKRYG